MSKLNSEYEHKIEKLHKHIEDIRREENIKQEKYSCQILELKEQIRQLKEKIQQSKMQSENDLNKLNKERDNELKMMNERNTQMLEEKVSLIMNLPQQIDKKTNENQKILDAKKSTKFELEKEYKQQIESLKQEYQKLLETSKQQYEFFLNKKNEEMDSYV